MHSPNLVCTPFPAGRPSDLRHKGDRDEAHAAGNPDSYSQNTVQIDYLTFEKCHNSYSTFFIYSLTWIWPRSELNTPDSFRCNNRNHLSLTINKLRWPLFYLRRRHTYVLAAWHKSISIHNFCGISSFLRANSSSWVHDLDFTQVQDTIARHWRHHPNMTVYLWSKIRQTALCRIEQKYSLLCYALFGKKSKPDCPLSSITCKVKFWDNWPTKQKDSSSLSIKALLDPKIRLQIVDNHSFRSDYISHRHSSPRTRSPGVGRLWLLWNCNLLTSWLFWGIHQNSQDNRDFAQKALS